MAIASETKSTPPDRMQYYLDTADKARLFTRSLRRLNGDFVQENNDWAHALEDLRRLPAQGEALQLCRMLRNIVTRDE